MRFNLKNLRMLLNEAHWQSDSKILKFMKDKTAEYYENRAMEAIHDAQTYPEKYDDNMILAIRCINMARLTNKHQDITDGPAQDKSNKN